MSHQSLASKIVSAAGGVPPKATWWPRHRFTMEHYLEFSAGQMSQKLAKPRATAEKQAGEWDAWMPEHIRKTGMPCHVRLEIELIDAARRNDEKSVEEIGNLLVDNAVDQARQLGKSIASFPQETFRRLIEEHVSLFVAHVRLAIEKKDTKPCAKRAEKNSLALADLTVEWF